jgi:hypothetical protein
MFSSYPAELPEMAANGWPALVFNFKAADRSGKPIALESAGAKGWKLAQAYDGRIVLSYDVDFSIFAAKSWPSPLESAYEDATHIVVSARSRSTSTFPARGVRSCRGHGARPREPATSSGPPRT